MTRVGRPAPWQKTRQHTACTVRMTQSRSYIRVMGLMQSRWPWSLANKIPFKCTNLWWNRRIIPVRKPITRKFQNVRSYWGNSAFNWKNRWNDADFDQRPTWRMTCVIIANYKELIISHEFALIGNFDRCIDDKLQSSIRGTWLISVCFQSYGQGSNPQVLS